MRTARRVDLAGASVGAGNALVNHGLSGVIRNAKTAYAIAVAISAVAVAVNLGENGLFGDRPFIAFYTAVVISAYVGGLGPGLLTTLLCATSVNFLLLQPSFSFAVRAGSDVAGVILFIIASAFICWMLHSVRRTAGTLRIERAAAPP